MSSRMQQWRAVEGVEVEGSPEAWLPGPGPCLAELEEPVGKRKREQFLEEELFQGHLCPTPIHICRRVRALATPHPVVTQIRAASSSLPQDGVQPPHQVKKGLPGGLSLRSHLYLPSPLPSTRAFPLKFLKP